MKKCFPELNESANAVLALRSENPEQSCSICFNEMNKDDSGIEKNIIIRKILLDKQVIL
jgi:hypothetical protein